METKVEDVNLENTGQVKAMGLMRSCRKKAQIEKSPALSPGSPDTEVGAQEEAGNEANKSSAKQFKNLEIVVSYLQRRYTKIQEVVKCTEWRERKYL